MKYTAAFALGTSLPARIVGHKLPHLSLAKHKAGKANGFQRWVHTPDSYKCNPGRCRARWRKKKQWKPMCFSRCIFLQLEAQSVKKIGKKRKKCKINAKVQTEMQPELQQSNDADTSCKKNATLGSPIFPLQKKCNWDRGLQKNEATTKLQKTCDVTDKVQKKSDVTGKV